MATLGMEAEVARSAMAEGASDFAIDPAGDPGRSSDRTTVRRCYAVRMSLYADHSTTELFVPPTQRANANKGELEIGRSSDGRASGRQDVVGERECS